MTNRSIGASPRQTDARSSISCSDPSSSNSITICSVDARGKYLKDAQHWSDEKVLFGRAHLKAATDKVRLLLEPVLREDEGIYKCRVDFKKSPTRHHRIQLAVISISA